MYETTHNEYEPTLKSYLDTVFHFIAGKSCGYRFPNAYNVYERMDVVYVVFVESINHKLIYWSAEKKEEEENVSHRVQLEPKRQLQQTAEWIVWTHTMEYSHVRQQQQQQANMQQK